jgi:hypothetical protein
VFVCLLQNVLRVVVRDRGTAEAERELAAYDAAAAAADRKQQRPFDAVRRRSCNEQSTNVPAPVAIFPPFAAAER